MLLDEWLEAGITHVLDTRFEADDAFLIHRHAPTLVYKRVPTDDDGRRQPDWWFDDGVSFARSALTKPGGVLLIHCSMGINRGPSMGFRILLDLEWEPIAALEAIRNARPIADVGYAQDALGHYHRTHDAPPDSLERDRDDVEAWLRGYERPAGRLIDPLSPGVG